MTSTLIADGEEEDVDVGVGEVIVAAGSSPKAKGSMPPQDSRIINNSVENILPRNFFIFKITPFNNKEYSVWVS
jgi:hypothetical protein